MYGQLAKMSKTLSPSRSTCQRQISDQEAGTAHDSMQLPTSATGHEEETQAAATGHEDAQATATGQEKKYAATGGNEQALAEAPSSNLDWGNGW